MDKNLNLTIGFKGQVKLNAEAVPLQEGYLKLGGIADDILKFGIVASADADATSTFGAGAGFDFVRGIVVFDDAIAQNAPAHPDCYLAGMPCAVLNHGFCYIGTWGKTATGAIDPTFGCKVIFKDATGEIEFIDAETSVPSSWTELTNAEVRDIDADKGALIYLN